MPEVISKYIFFLFVLFIFPSFATYEGNYALSFDGLDDIVT